MLNKITTLILTSIIILFSTNSKAAQVSLENPYVAIKKIAGNTFDCLAKDQSVINDDPNHLKVVVEEELLPYIDYKYAALKVLGSYISKVKNIEDKAERKKEYVKIKRFIGVFKGYLVTTYAGVFTQYTIRWLNLIPLRN